MQYHRAGTRRRVPLGFALLAALLGHAWLLQPGMPVAQHTAQDAGRAVPLRLMATRTTAPAEDPSVPARAAAPSQPAEPPPVPAAPTVAYVGPETLDRPLVPRSAPDLRRLQGLHFSGLPIRLRLFIDPAGRVSQVTVLAAQEDDETLAAVTGMFEATSFVPGRRAGVPVASFTDIELRLDGSEG